MQINVSSKHMELTPAIEAAVPLAMDAVRNLIARWDAAAEKQP